MNGTVPWQLAVGLILTTCGAFPLGYAIHVLWRTAMGPDDIRGLKFAVGFMFFLFFAGLTVRAPYVLSI